MANTILSIGTSGGIGRTTAELFPEEGSITATKAEYEETFLAGVKGRMDSAVELRPLSSSVVLKGDCDRSSWESR